MRATSVMAMTAVGLTVLATSASAQAPTTVNDPLSGVQWGLAQVRAEQAWASSTGAGQVVAIVDTGVDLAHPDLKSKLVPGATFVDCARPPGPCGNGDWRGTDGQGQEADGHGTHVAGIAAATTDNGLGVAGVAPDASIMPVKVLDDGSGSFEDVASGIRYAADHGASVVNLSLAALPGGQLLTLTGLSSATKEAITYARSRGVAVVAAAGNETAPLCDTPAWEEGALCVTATDRAEDRALYSNLGLNREMKAVAAPGGAGVSSCDDDVWSTVPTGTGSDACGQRDYDAFAGTSMATPHVAGVVALLSAQGRTADEIETTLMNTARTPGSDERGSFTPMYGYGIVDAEAAVSYQP